MEKFITLSQLESIVKALKTLIDGKANEGQSASFSEVKVGSITLSSDANDRLVVTDNNDNSRIVTYTDDVDSSQYVDTLTVDKIRDYNTDKTNDAYTVYSLPSSTAATKLESISVGNGGGTILTTKHRSYTLHTQTISSNASQTILINPYIYYRIICEPGSSVALSFQDDPSSTCDEWWVDISLGTPTVVPSASTPDPVNVTIYRTFVWVNGAPDFAELQNKRVRIHVLYDTASYEMIG